jgi:cytochrome c-type biogenesis protein CcmH/NrfG
MSLRFCAQCGTKAPAAARFCTECGTRLANGTAPAAGTGWRVTTAGAAVLTIFLAAGLAIWTLILSPAAPRGGPGRTAAHAPATPMGDTPATGEGKARIPLPAEAASFIADLAAKAKEKPTDVPTWLKLAQVDARAAQLDPAYQADALGAFQHVLDIDAKNADALRGLANIHYDRDDHAHAIPIFERYLALRPDDPSARTDLATMYLYSGDATRAIATYKDVIKQNPSFLQAHYNLAVTYHQQRDDPAALGELEIARGLATEDPVRKQIDDMIASLRGEGPAPGRAAAAPAPDGAGGRTPFQGAVEQGFRASPIMGSRIVRFEWTAPGSGRVLVENFPMEGMPPAVRDKFTARLADELRGAAGSHPVDGPVRVEIADVATGSVMATVTP